MVQRRVSSPVGELQLVASDDALIAIYFPAHRYAKAVEASACKRGENAVLDLAERELGEYFRGERRTFTVPMKPEGTAFQRSVWRALRAIPFGKTWSYAELATKIGRPGAARAVGSANARNPLSIIVPCHRVIGASGELTGYAGNTDRKRWLLEHEHARA